MLPRLILLFVSLPLIELIILVKLGEVIGFWATISMVIITGILGASLARYQGFAALQKIQLELANGNIPTYELIDGLLILIGGIVLLTPGLLTDLFGFSMLIPWVRLQVKGWLHKKFGDWTQSGQTQFFVGGMR